jgi:Icc-related predicted phosphoesterase
MNFTKVPEVDHSHVLLVSDPQVQDPLTLLDSWWILVHIKQWIFSSNLRKSWNAVSKLKPDLTIFMGDMLASGRYATSEAECVPFPSNVSIQSNHLNSFAQYARHFKNIFTIPAAQKVAYIPGNNDIP